MMADTTAASARRLEAIRILERLEVSGQINPDEKRQLDTLRANADADTRNVAATGARYRGFAQGATLGAADEIGAGFRSVANAVTGGAVGAPYDEALTGIRNANDAARFQHPEAFQTGRIAGAAATAAVPFAGTMSAMRGATLGGQALASGLMGAGISGAQGFLEGEGGLGPRMSNAADPVNLGIGFGTGAVAPLAGRAMAQFGADVMEPVGRPVVNMGFDPQAARLAVRSFADDAAVVADPAARLAELGPEGMIADLGRNTRMQASGVTRVPGAGGNRIVAAMDERDAGTAARVAAEMDTAAGSVADQAAAGVNRARARSSAAGPLYDAAKAIPDPLDMGDAADTIGGLIKDRAPGHAKLKVLLDDIGEDARPIVVHNRRSELSDAAREARRSGRDKEAMTYEAALEALDKRLDTVPGYADARRIWADSKALDEAAETGAALFKPGTRTDELRLRWARMSEPERDAFRSAARAELDREMARAVQEGNKGLNLIGPRDNRAKIELVFGDGSADQLMRRMEAEKTFKATRQKATQGSETAANMAAQREILPLVDEAGNRLGPVARGRQAVSDPVNQVIDALLRRPKGKALDDLAQILTAQGAQRDDIVRALIASQAGNRTNAAISSGAQRVLQALMQSGGVGLATAAAD